jgi:hypothetical protein
MRQRSTVSDLKRESLETLLSHFVFQPPTPLGDPEIQADASTPSLLLWRLAEAQESVTIEALIGQLRELTNRIPIDKATAMAGSA